MGEFNYSATVNLSKKEGNLKGFANVAFMDGQTEVFLVKGIKVMDGSKGLFLSMPSTKQADGSYKDSAFPLTKEFREELEAVIISEYKEKAGEAAKPETPPQGCKG